MSEEADFHQQIRRYHDQLLTDVERDVGNIVESTFASRYAVSEVPKDRIPISGMPSRVAYQLIHDIRQLDCNPRLNLASFVTTWMEPEANELIQESMSINYVDMDQYKSSTDIQNRCVKMLANLWHAPPLPADCDMDGCGTATIGSSEAIMLAGLAMKMKWQERRRKQGKDTTKPNIVMSASVYVVHAAHMRACEACCAPMPRTARCAGRSLRGTGALRSDLCLWKRAVTS